MRKVKEIEQDMEEWRLILINILKEPNSIYAIDLIYIAQNINDLKQELRITKASQ